MHELFICASISVDSVQEVLRILAGYTHTHPVQIFKRKLFYEGPKQPEHGDPPLQGFSKEILMPTNNDEASMIRAERWKELDTQIRKVSYYISAIWQEDRASAASAPPTEPNRRPGTVRFVGVPEFQGPIVSRLLILVEDDFDIPTKLKSVGYKKIGDSATEMWRCFYDRMTFELMRIIPNQELSQVDLSQLSARQIHNEAYGGKWMLTVRVEVVDGTKPELMREARRLLEKVLQDLGNYVEWDTMKLESCDPRVRS